jgi:hypothetical protein
MPAELQQYVGGRTFAYATDDGQRFDRVALPDLPGWGSQAVAADDGYRLFASENGAGSASTTVLRSADGRSWTVDGMLDGSYSAVGLLGDRPAVALWTVAGDSVVQVQRADGSWGRVDLLSAIVPPAGEELFVADVAFGPLGMAATVLSSAKEEATEPHSYLVHSSDGVALSVLDLDDYFGPETGGTMGVTVSADAITLRSVHAPDGDRATVEPTDVLIGTPR